VHRVADLHLRGAAGRIRLRARWPAPTDARTAPALLVLFHSGGSRLGQWLCAAAGVVVLAASCPVAFQDAVTTTEWAADHAAELGADPARLLVAGEGAGGRLAAAVALHARDHEWPPLTRQVLIRPVLDTQLLAESVAGAAPATLVAGRRYAARFRRAGVPVEEVRYPELARALRKHLQP
jgi:acetyl esterase